MQHIQGKAAVRAKTIIIPLCHIGKAGKNLIFCEKRIHQGLSGKVFSLSDFSVSAHHSA